MMMMIFFVVENKQQSNVLFCLKIGARGTIKKHINAKKKLFLFRILNLLSQY